MSQHCCRHRIPLASVNNEYNAVYVYGEAVGETMFYGPGAGSLPTATAVVSDLVGVVKNMRLGVNGRSLITPQYEKQLKDDGEVISKYFLRLHVHDEVGVFSEITALFADHNVSFEKILQMPLKEKELAEIVVVTHQASLKDYQNILMELRDLRVVKEVKSSYRVEGSVSDMRWRGLLSEYREYLPVNAETPLLTLHEGNTPLIRLDLLSEEWGIDLFVKVEGVNPTGSFKDRGMVMAVAKAKEAGSDTVICASTGNTSASAAAYAARAGLRSIIVIPDGKIAMGKLAQAVMYGASIVSIEGNFDEALKMVRAISETEPVTLVNSVNPYRLEGQKTAAFEICDQLGGAPDILAIPVGNAGNISAYWKGFKEYNRSKSTGLPRMFGFEAEGAAAIVKGQPIEQPETIATAIRIGNPASWDLAVEARDESEGKIDFVSDDEILQAYSKLAGSEGIFAEPGSCASLAGIHKLLQRGEIPRGSRIVAVLTGNGLKDPSTAIDISTISPVLLPNDESIVSEYIRGVVRQ